MKALIDELTRVSAQAQALVDEHKGKEWPAEKRGELDRLLADGIALRERVQQSEQTAAKEADVASLVNFLGQPQYKVPRGVGNGDSDTKAALIKGGWEIKNGMVRAPTSLGTYVEMFPEEVLFGPMPDDKDADAPNARRYYKSMRAAMQPEYREAYLKYLHTVVRFRSEAMAFAQLTNAEQKALSEGTDTAGGFLVPPDAQAEMLVRLPNFAVMRRFAQVQTTSRDKVSWPRVQAHATDASIYSSGFVGDWAGEAPAFSDTDPKFGTFDIAVKKIRVATKLSNDFINDSAVNVLAFLSRNGAENMGLVEDKGFINGDGTALQPKGILQSGATEVDVEGSTANTISNTTSNAGSAPKLIDLVYALPSQYVRNARWVMRRAIEAEIRKLVDGQGRYLWPAALGSQLSGVAKILMDYPVENSEFVPDDGTDANRVLIFGDLSAYVIAQRAQITTTILRERFADTDQVGIIIWERVGGDCWNPDAIRIGKV